MSIDFNIGDSLSTRAYLNPTKEAVYDVVAQRRLSFSELNSRANQACSGLQSLGINKGDRVALLV